MPTVQDLKPWRAELKEILDVCARRASLPVSLPHCAICARYTTDNLPFEALMSLLDAMPEGLRAEAGGYLEDEATLAYRTRVRKEIDVNLTRQTVTLLEDGKVVYTTLASTGVPSNEYVFEKPRSRATRMRTSCDMVRSCEIRAMTSEIPPCTSGG